MHALVKKDILTTLLGSGCRCASSYLQKICKAGVETTPWSEQLLFRRRRGHLAISCPHLDTYCARSWGTSFGFMELQANWMQPLCAMAEAGVQSQWLCPQDAGSS